MPGEPAGGDAVAPAPLRRGAADIRWLGFCSTDVRARLVRALSKSFDAIEEEALMSKFFLTSSLALGLGLGTLAAAEEPKTDAVKGSPVTISGCVVSDKTHSFVLTHVEEISGPRSAASTPVLGETGMERSGGDLVYWLSHDSVKLMRGHLGHKVQVTGTITDVSTGTVRLKQEPGKPGPDNKIEVAARGKEATAKTDTPVKPGPPPAGKSDETKTVPVRRVKVDTVKMLAETCP
jgi:hypothetical protein